MWTYILRRLLIMIPTLFGVTIVSFMIMQIAPGDPLASQGAVGGAMGERGETREAYLIRKRDLKLDKPLLLNFRYFHDYRGQLQEAAWVRSHSKEEIVAELGKMAQSPDDPELARRKAFFRNITDRNISSLRQWSIFFGMVERSKRNDFTNRLADSDKHARLASAIYDYVQMWCEDIGHYAVPDAIALLDAEDATSQQKRGLISCLSFMVVEPFRYTYSRDASPAETEDVLAVWRAWWERNQQKFPPLDPDRRATLQQNLDAMVAAESRRELFRLLEQFQLDYFWDFPDMRFFAEKLLGESSFEEKVICSTILKLFVSDPLPLELSKNADSERIDNVAQNWRLAYELREHRYNPSFPAKVWAIVADTQYAHMVWRLATFRFGRSTQKTREPVSELIWDAVKVSAPLMFMSGVLIYAVAIPLGLVCGVWRGRWADRLVSLGLFVLYSVPPFVAGMLFLLYLSYGDYLKIFPMERLHSDNAENFGYVKWLLDYLWHAALPVFCLSLFSLAPLSMYARTSLLEVLGQDFIRTARAKGLSERRVILVHALRNALIPLITLFASFLPALLGGSVLIEYLFSVPGMGKLSWEAILLKDYPVVMALIYINAIVVMLSILLSDILYVFVDPRITFEGRSG